MHSGERFFDRYRLAFIGIVILSALVYLPSLYGQAMCDDKSILGGAGIGGGKSLWDCFAHPFLFHYYRPLTSASYFLDLHFFGPMRSSCIRRTSCCTPSRPPSQSG